MPYVYSPPNWLYQKGSDTRTKTASGNTASISGLASFTYDGFNRLATSQTAAETTTYTYNALGQRMKKINQNGLSTVFHYGPDGELLWEKDANGNTKAYVWLDGRPLARIDNDASIYYYHVDHLGTPQAMTDSAGTVVWQANYEPFGKATVSAASTVENNLRFPGQYYDRETGLHYNYFRDYEPGTGRYVEADPIGLEGGLNLYAYVGGNPVSRIDPSGLTAISFNSATGTLMVDPEVKGRLPYTMAATSGVPNCGCDAASPDKGRIPSGRYTAMSSELTDAPWHRDLARTLAGVAGISGGGDWGDWRVALHPDRGTNTFGRKGFMMHGGFLPGSAGCIDVGGGIFGNTLTNQLMKDILNDPDGRVQVIVK